MIPFVDYTAKLQYNITESWVVAGLEFGHTLQETPTVHISSFAPEWQHHADRASRTISS